MRHPVVRVPLEMPCVPQLDQMIESDHPAVSSLAQLSESGGKVSPVKVRDFVAGLKIGLNRALSPGVNNFDNPWLTLLLHEWAFFRSFLVFYVVPGVSDLHSGWYFLRFITVTISVRALDKNNSRNKVTARRYQHVFASQSQRKTCIYNSATRLIFFLRTPSAPNRGAVHDSAGDGAFHPRSRSW